MQSVNPVTLTNKNPIICPAKDNGKQDIGLFDKNVGNMRFVSATTEEVDEFVADRTNLVKKNEKKLIAGMGIGAIIGFVASALGGKSNKLDNKLVMQCFAPFTGLISGLTIAGLTCKPLQKLDQQFIEEHK